MRGWGLVLKFHMKNPLDFLKMLCNLNLVGVELDGQMARCVSVYTIEALGR